MRHISRWHESALPDLKALSGRPCRGAGLPTSASWQKLHPHVRQSPDRPSRSEAEAMRSYIHRPDLRQLPRGCLSGAQSLPLSLGDDRSCHHARAPILWRSRQRSPWPQRGARRRDRRAAGQAGDPAPVGRRRRLFGLPVPVRPRHAVAEATTPSAKPAGVTCWSIRSASIWSRAARSISSNRWAARPSRSRTPMRPRAAAAGQLRVDRICMKNRDFQRQRHHGAAAAAARISRRAEARRALPAGDQVRRRRLPDHGHPRRRL